MGSDPVADASITDAAHGGGGGMGPSVGGAGGGQAGAGGVGGSGGASVGGASVGSGGSAAGAGGSTSGAGGKGGTSGGGGSSGGVGGRGGSSGGAGSTGATGGKAGSGGIAGAAGRGGQSDAGRDADAAPPFDSGSPDIDAGCTISCGSGPCPIRSGVPRVIVSRPSDQPINAIAVNADTLYFGTYPNQSDGGIYSMPLAGGAPTLLVGSVRISELRLDGDTLYYVSQSGSGLSTATLRAIPAAGGAPRDIAQAPQIKYVTPAAEGIYFGRGWSDLPQQVVRTSRDGTGEKTIMTLFGTLWGIALDDQRFCIADYDHGGLLIGTSWGTVQSPEPLTSPLIDGTDLVFVEGVWSPDTCRSAVMMLTAGQGSTRISPGTSGVDVMGLARDDAHIYWSSTGARGAVLRVQKGQTPEIIAPDQQYASPPVLGPTDVYWIARAGSTYDVRTVPK